ncbi:LAME_0F13894g1_1 [Lachancea meyersii CBS 8951]|uniref:Polyprenal reductase n=1 Tax=Lachancea meyersii CBS 8951 TaxID=1266667 RepID=A0A1G4JXN1_9SACH|nr:LAME_0F13894g1_1 [Lachancea meyersii CBS 8951]
MLDLLLGLLDPVFYATFLLGLVSLVVAKLQAPILLKYGKTLPQSAGRHYSESFWGQFQRLTVPKAWFSHFYVYSVFVSSVNMFLLQFNLLSILIAVHSARRLYETVYVNVSKPSARIHVSHYLVGFWFYSAVNYAASTSSPETWSSLPVRCLALLLFALASWDQHENHLHLSKLRKYTLPTYGLFRIVASAHYFDEFLLYFALTLFTGASAKLLVCLLWVIANLSFSAVETRAWYLQKFTESTPRFAILPYML